MKTAQAIISESVTREDALALLWEERRKDEGKDPDILEKLEKAEREIKEVPVLTVTLAIDLVALEREDFSEKARKLFKTPLFVDLRTDPGIIGGAVVIWKGQVLDYSIKKTIKEKAGEVRKIVNQMMEG